MALNVVPLWVCLYVHCRLSTVQMAIRVVRNMKLHGRDSACSLLIGQTIALFFFLVIVAPAFIITVHGQAGCNPAIEVPSYKCNRTINSTAIGTFENNLNTVLDGLAEGASQNGFKISVSGQIYGLFQCRADLTVDQCTTCWQLATSTLQSCANASGGSTWPFHCFLRYESYNFTGKLILDRSNDPGPCTDASSVAGVFLSPGFTSVAENLLKNLSVEAAGKTERSALGLSQTIYGLVQCTRDLSANDCTTCLTSAINYIFTFDSNIVGFQYWSQSCILRYQIYPFFNLTAVSPPKGPPTQIKSLNKTLIILGVVGASVLVLILCAFATRRRLKSAKFRRGYEGIATTWWYELIGIARFLQVAHNHLNQGLIKAGVHIIRAMFPLIQWTRIKVKVDFIFGPLDRGNCSVIRLLPN